MDAVLTEGREAPRATEDPGERSDAPARTISFRRIPWLVWVVAVLAGGLHTLAFARAELSTPPGWTFTGMLSANPDEAQYGVWERRSQEVGPIVDNTLTTEPNRRYLPVFFFWGVGKVASWVHVAPAKVYAYGGAVLAFLLTLLVYVLARHFLRTRHQVWWVFLAIVLGGGLGAHVQWARALVGLEPMQGYGGSDSWVFFEAYRAHFVLKGMLDTFVSFIWVLMLLAVVAYYNALNRLTVGRVLLAAAAFAAVTVAHVYEGVTLLAIAAGVLGVYALQRRDVVRPGILLVVLGTAVGACYAALGLLFLRSGLPFPTWRALNILPSLLFLAYPLAWLVLAWGAGRYWRTGGSDGAFLFGWVIGCTAVTLSGPFFRYPDRGVVTLQAGLFLLAGAIYFSKRPRLSRAAAIITVAVLGVFPLRLAWTWWQQGDFSAARPFTWLDQGRQRVIETLRARAGSRDVLVADDQDALWLEPSYPGRVWAGHFFLTVRYREKFQALQRFLGDPVAERDFLRRSGARFLFVRAARQPERFAALGELEPIERESSGWLFLVRPEAGAPASAPAAALAP